MKTKILLVSLFVLGLFIFNPVQAEEEVREVATFSEISLKVDAKLYLKQGDEQSVKIVAKESVLEKLITEVKGRKLTIRFPNTTMLQNFNPGKIEIYVTVPEINVLTVSGSGDLVAEELSSRILELSVSGSADIVIKDGGVADELSSTISGSGSVKAEGFEAKDVSVRISGSGSCFITSNGSIKARISGSGSVNYKGNPSIDSSVAGSGKVKEMN
jgi:hypothetical protein